MVVHGGEDNRIRRNRGRPAVLDGVMSGGFEQQLEPLVGDGRLENGGGDAGSAHLVGVP